MATNPETAFGSQLYAAFGVSSGAIAGAVVAALALGVGGGAWVHKARAAAADKPPDDNMYTEMTEDGTASLAAAAAGAGAAVGVGGRDGVQRAARAHRAGAGGLRARLGLDVEEASDD